MRKEGIFVLGVLLGFLWLPEVATGQLLGVTGGYATGVNEVWGMVLDSAGRAYLPYAHVYFIHGKDTSRLASDVYGRFTYKGQLADTMRVRVTAVGYKPLEDWYYPKRHGFSIRLLLRREAVALNEIIITGKQVAMVVKGDTLKYNAEAFTALEGDFMDVLLKKMPGVTYENGDLRVNGEPISRVYVNGSDALFKSARDVIQNVKADNVKDIKVYDERNKEDRKMGLKYGKRETVMDVTTKQKINAVKRGSAVLGLGTDVSSDRLTEFKGKYNGKLDYSYYVPGKNLSYSLYGTNVSSDLSVERENFGGRFNYSRDVSETFKFSTSNSYDNKTDYRNTWNEWHYFPTELYASREYTNKLFTRHTSYTYQTNNSITWSKYGLLQARIEYQYRGNKRRQAEQSVSVTDGRQVGQADVRDHEGQHASSLVSTLGYSRSLPCNMRFTFGTTLEWDEGRGDGWRVDTVDESTDQVYLDKDADNREVKWIGGITLDKTLSPLWRMSLGYSFDYRDNESKGEVIDRLTGWIDSTNTRDYSIYYWAHKLEPGLSFYSKKSTIYLRFGMKFITRNHVERFPERYDASKHFCFFMPSLQWDLKFSPTAKVQFVYHLYTELPSVEETRAVINDLNPLALRVGNPNIRVSYQHEIGFELNNTFVQQASSLWVRVNYRITDDDIATDSRYFTEDTYLPEYDYTVPRGATLYSAVNTEPSHRLYANARYSKLSNWLQSRVTLSLGYEYGKIPAFSQGVSNDLTRNIGSFGINMLSNFSRKIELSLGVNSTLSCSESELDKSSEILDEKVTFTVRTDFIPKFHVTSTLNYRYGKDFSRGGSDYSETQWNATISRKLGKQATLSLEGYNLLDTQDSRSLGKTSEYMFRTEKSQTGRYVLLSLKYNFK